MQDWWNLGSAAREFRDNFLCVGPRGGVGFALQLPHASP